MKLVLFVALVGITSANLVAALQVVRNQNDTATEVHVRRARSVSDGEVAKRFGKYVMYHMFSELKLENACKEITGLDAETLKANKISDMKTCLLKGKEDIISMMNGGYDIVETSIVYYTLLDLAANEPNRGSLLLKDLSGSGPKLGLTWIKSRVGDIRKKLPRNKEFNQLYEKHIVRPCELIVKSYVKSGGETLADAYAALAHRTCKNLVLDPKKLKAFPEVITAEHQLIHSGQEAFSRRLPAEEANNLD